VRPLKYGPSRFLQIFQFFGKPFSIVGTAREVASIQLESWHLSPAVIDAEDQLFRFLGFVHVDLFMCEAVLIEESERLAAIGAPGGNINFDLRHRFRFLAHYDAVAQAAALAEIRAPMILVSHSSFIEL